jgi:biopolymer transport protein ExbD
MKSEIDEEFSGINVIPLVDIMLVLLTIVLITSNFMVRGIIPMNLPKSDSAAADTLKEAIVVEITKEAVILYNGALVDLSELPAVLADFDRDSRVIVSADKDLTLQPFVQVLDMLKNIGFSKISIQTER